MFFPLKYSPGGNLAAGMMWAKLAGKREYY